eukprot:403372697
MNKKSNVTGHDQTVQPEKDMTTTIEDKATKLMDNFKLDEKEKKQERKPQKKKKREKSIKKKGINKTLLDEVALKHLAEDLSEVYEEYFIPVINFKTNKFEIAPRNNTLQNKQHFSHLLLKKFPTEFQQMFCVRINQIETLQEFDKEYEDDFRPEALFQKGYLCANQYLKQQEDILENSVQNVQRLATQLNTAIQKAIYFESQYRAKEEEVSGLTSSLNQQSAQNKQLEDKISDLKQIFGLSEDSNVLNNQEPAVVTNYEDNKNESNQHDNFINENDFQPNQDFSSMSAINQETSFDKQESSDFSQDQIEMGAIIEMPQVQQTVRNEDVPQNQQNTAVYEGAVINRTLVKRQIRALLTKVIHTLKEMKELAHQLVPQQDNSNQSATQNLQSQLQTIAQNQIIPQSTLPVPNSLTLDQIAAQQLRKKRKLNEISTTNQGQ